MLVLRRNPGEGITIRVCEDDEMPSEDNIHIVNLGGGRIGIDAPTQHLILRDELITHPADRAVIENRQRARDSERLLGRYGG